MRLNGGRAGGCTPVCWGGEWSAGVASGGGPERPRRPAQLRPVFQDYSIDEEAAFQAALALSLSEN